MFIAMNRFHVKKGAEKAFEQVWLNRDTHLTAVPGFIEFHLLKGPEHEDYTLYTSHSVWQSRPSERDQIGSIPSCPPGCRTEQAALPRRFRVPGPRLRAYVRGRPGKEYHER